MSNATRNQMESTMFSTLLTIGKFVTVAFIVVCCVFFPFLAEAGLKAVDGMSE